MMSDFPIVKMDRATLQEFLPIVMNKGIFSDYKELPMKESLLKEGKIKLGVEQLYPQQEREILCDAGIYKTDKFLVRDYGRYAIAFSSRMFLESLEEAEQSISRSMQEDARLNSALKRIRLYKLAHKLILIIISEAYHQRKYQNLVITKSRILTYLNHSTTDKYIYRDISDAMFSLTWLNYQIFEYKTKNKLSANTTGVFMYNVREDQNSYTVSINEVFLGCVLHLLGEKKNDKTLYERGYINFPTAILPLTQQYTTPAYLLTIFLLSESGNVKLRQPGVKVVAYKGSKLAEVANLAHSRENRVKENLIDALQEIHIIERMDPPLEHLRKMRASALLETTIRIYLKSRKQELNETITSNLLGAK